MSLVKHFHFYFDEHGIGITDKRDLTALSGERTYMFVRCHHMSKAIERDVTLCLEQLIIENDILTLESISAWLISRYRYEGYEVFYNRYESDVYNSSSLIGAFTTYLDDLQARITQLKEDNTEATS